MISKRKIKRIVLAEGKHWFYDKSSLAGYGKSGEPYNLIGILNENNELISFSKLPMS